VVPIAMFNESIVGISARLFQAFQFFQRQWKLTSEQSSKTSLSIHIERNLPLVIGEHILHSIAHIPDARTVPVPRKSPTTLLVYIR
jgi:hypothetical protein